MKVWKTHQEYTTITTTTTTNNNNDNINDSNNNNIQTDHLILARRLDLVIINKFRNKITNYWLRNHMYKHLTVYKQMSSGSF